MRRAGMEEAEEGLRIGGRKINNLRYADDTTLVAANITDLQNLIGKVKSSSEEAGLFLNVKKTKIMSTTNLQRFKLGNEELEVVSSFSFLGSTIQENGDCKEDIVKRLALGRAAVVGLDKIWKGKDVRVETKVRLMEALVFPVAMYGAESWTTRKADIKKIEAFENWCWRKMLRISWTEKRTNASIQQQLGITTSLVNRIRRNKLIYFGHIMRSNSLEKDMIVAMGEGQRKRGRPRSRWLDSIEEDTGMSLQELTETTRDRTEWRRKVMMVTRGRMTT